MKPILFGRWLFALVGFMAIMVQANAQTAWTPPTGGSWTNAANWSPASVPSDVAASVIFSANFTNAPTFTLDTNAVTVNRLSYQDLSNSYYPGTLTPGSPAGKLYFAGLNPAVDTPAGADNTADLTITCPVVMTNGLTKTGARMATFSGSSFSGGGALTVSGGTLAFSGNYLPAFTNATVASGATLEPYYNANVTQTKFPLTLSGSGPMDTAGNYLNATPGALWFRNPTTTIIWPGAITLSNGATIGSFGSTCRQIFTGGIAGTGPMVFLGGGAGATSQTGLMTISNTPCTYTGNTTVMDDTSLAWFMLRLAVNNALPTNTALTLSLADNGPTTGVILDLYGHNQTLAGLNNDAQGYANKYLVINSGSSAATLTLGSGTPSFFSGVIGTNGANNLNLVLQGNTVTLSGTNQYTGTTTINAGELIGVTGGSCAGSAVTVANGATLGVQVLNPGDQWSCASLTLNSGTTTIACNYLTTPSAVTAPLQVNGSVVNNGTLNVIVQGTGFANGGTYPLIHYTGSLTPGTLGTATLVNGGTGTLVNNAVAHRIDLLVSFNNTETVRVEAAPDGSAGTALPAQIVSTGGSLTGYAIKRNSSGLFLSNCPALWVLTNLTGSVNSGDLTVAPDNLSAMFTGHGTGSARILAVDNTTNLVVSGVITVVSHATTAMRLQSGSGGEDDFVNNPGSFPVSKAGMTYMYYNGTVPVASNHLFNTSQAMVVFECTSNTTANDFFTGTNDVVPAIQQFENNGWNIYGVWVLREDWLTGMIPQGQYGAYDWRILSGTEITNIRNAIATSTLHCKNTVKLIQLLGSGAATALGETQGHAANFPTFPTNVLQLLSQFDGLGVECHVGYETQAPDVLTAMTDIAKWCATNNKVTFQFMGGGANTYSNLPATQQTYEYLWSLMLANGVNYRSNNIIYFRQGGRPGQMVPESNPATLSHQEAWLINALANGSLTISDLPDQTVNNTVTTVVAFNVSEAENPATAITITASCSNPSVVGNTGMVVSGRGANRILSITPAPLASGVTTITLVATDGTLYTTNSFQLTVTPYNVVNAAAAGPINTNTTWGTAIPVAGDTSTWQTAYALNLTQAASDTFNGQTLEILTNSQFAPGVPTATLNLNNFILNGGTVYMGNNNGITVDFSGRQCTLNSGTLKGGTGSSMDITLQDGTLAGNGTINIIGVSANGGAVQLLPSLSTLGFSGIFRVATNGILQLPFISTNDASFGLNLSGTGQYYNNTNVAVTSLVIGGTNIPPGTYGYANFPGYLLNNGGTLTVVGTNSPPTLTAIANRTLVAGQTLTFTNTASDTNVPAQTLTFTLPTAPTGAVIDPLSGVFSWRPVIAQSPTTNLVSVVVRDSGLPTLSATQSFNVTVTQPAKPSLRSLGLTNGLFSLAVSGTNGPDYIVLTSTNLLNWTPLATNNSPVLPFTFTDATTNSSLRFYRVLLGP